MCDPIDSAITMASSIKIPSANNSATIESILIEIPKCIIRKKLAKNDTGRPITTQNAYLKEKNSKIKVWGIDTYGSAFKKYHETGIFDEKEIYPYSTEGIGEDILPKNVDFEVIDHFEKVTDKDAALYTRKLAREEGILAGNSCGAAIAGMIQLKSNFKKGQVVVALLHDSGSRYIGKIYNDDWMKDNGFKTN